MRYFRQASLLLTLVFMSLTVSFGCNDSENFVFTQPQANVAAAGSGTLVVSLAPNPTAQSVDSLFQVTSGVVNLQVEVYTPDNQLVDSQTVGRNDEATFTDLAFGDYLVRVVGQDSSGNPLGFFDRVVTISSELTTVIFPGLRNTTVIPPADFPEPGTGASFFLITQSPTQIVAGEDFTLSIKAFNAQSQPLEEVVSGISFTAYPL